MAVERRPCSKHWTRLQFLGVQPRRGTAITHNAAMDTSGEAGQWETAFNVALEFARRGVRKRVASPIPV